MSRCTKDDLEKMIISENKTFKEVGEIYGVSGVYIRKLCINYGIKLPERAKRIGTHNKGKKNNFYYCLNCSKEIFKKTSEDPKFCNCKCSGEFRIQTSIKYWLENQEEFKNVLMNHSKGHLKKFLLDEQCNRCQICDISDTWNGKKMIFILDHINGDACNNTKENIRLICHNCDSQLPTYKRKNKKSSRIKRYRK